PAPPRRSPLARRLVARPSTALPHGPLPHQVAVRCGPSLYPDSSPAVVFPSPPPQTDPAASPSCGCGFSSPSGTRGRVLSRPLYNQTLRGRRDDDAVALGCPTDARITRVGVERERDRVRLGRVEGINLIAAAFDREAGHGGPGAHAVAITAGVEQIGETEEGAFAAAAKYLRGLHVQEGCGTLADKLGLLLTKDFAVRADTADCLSRGDRAECGHTGQRSAADVERQQIEATRI